MAPEITSFIPPLLPLEYCTIDRAARMLQCEESDIHHWAGVAAIRLTVFVEQNTTAKVLRGDTSGWESGGSIYGYIPKSDDGPFVKHFSKWASAERFKTDSVDEIYIKGFWCIDLFFYENHGRIIAWPFEDSSANDVPQFVVEMEIFTLAQLTEEQEALQLLSSLKVMKPDLIKLHNAIYKNQPLESLFELPDAKSAQESIRESVRSVPRLGRDSLLLSLGIMADLIAENKDSHIKPSGINAASIANKVIDRAKNKYRLSPEDAKLSNLRKDIMLGFNGLNCLIKQNQ